jgi:hypothetical protein
MDHSAMVLYTASTWVVPVVRPSRCTSGARLLRGSATTAWRLGRVSLNP